LLLRNLERQCWGRSIFENLQRAQCAPVWARRFGAHSASANGLLPMTPSSLELLRGLEQSLTAPLRRRPGRELSLLAITSSGEVRSAASAARPGGNACPRRLERARPAAGTCRSR